MRAWIMDGLGCVMHDHLHRQYRRRSGECSAVMGRILGGRVVSVGPVVAWLAFGALWTASSSSPAHRDRIPL